MAFSKTSVALLFSFLFLASFSLPSSARNADKNKRQYKPCKTLRLYFHDIVYNGHNADNATSFLVAAREGSDLITLASKFHFGDVVVFDDPVTLDNNLHSEPVGSAQGMYLYNSRSTYTAFIGFSFVLNSSDHQGTINFVGADLLLQDSRDISVVGGTGDFFMHQGIATLRTDASEGFVYFRLSVDIKFYQCWDTVECYSKELKDVAMAIIGQMSKALKIEEKEMREVFENGVESMRMNYYPPCPEPDKVIGLNPHSDGAALTILLQVNDVQGLQIENGGEWVPIMPLPDAFVVNIGNILEIITNGAYKSIEHRATVNSAKERMSIATFYNPTYEGKLGPASSLITEQTPPLFKTVTVPEYLNGLFSRRLDGKSYLDTLRIENVNG